MKILDILKGPKKAVITQLVQEIQESESITGDITPEELADKRYRKVVFMHNNFIQWWKLVKTDNNNFMLLSFKSNEVVLIKVNGEIVYTDSLTNKRDAFYYSKLLKAITYYNCSRKKAIENVFSLYFERPREFVPRNVIGKLNIHQ